LLEVQLTVLLGSWLMLLRILLKVRYLADHHLPLQGRGKASKGTDVHLGDLPRLVKDPNPVQVPLGPGK